MAVLCFSFSKLIQCVETFLNSTNTSGNLFSNNKLTNCRFTRCFVKKKSFILIHSLCGFFGKEKSEVELCTADDVTHNVTLATLALKDGNVEKSKRLLMKTLNLAETSNFISGIISTCDILSSLEMKSGDYERAEDLLIRALNGLFRQGASIDDKLVINFNLKLSRIYSFTGNDELAELGFRNCLHVQKTKLEKCLDKNAYLQWATIQYWYGKFLVAKNRYQEAKFCFQDCYATSIKLEHFSPSQIMVILYNLGEVCQLLGEYDEASKYFSIGVSFDEKEKNPDLAYFYAKLGTISTCKGLYKEAQFSCNRAKKIALKYKNLDAEKLSTECLKEVDDFLFALSNSK